MSARTPLAWKNLTHTITRTIVSLGGIGFAIVLMFMQLGFLGSVGETATVVLDRVPHHLIVRSPDYLHIYDPATLPDDLTRWLRPVPEVAEVTPLDIGVTQWQNPMDRSFRAIAIMGISLDQPAFALPELNAETIAALRVPGNVLIDDASGKDFGPKSGKQFGPADIGTTTDVATQPATIVGTFQMGTGLAANGALLVSRDTYAQLVPARDRRDVSLVLVSLRPGVDKATGLKAVQNRIDSLSGPARYANAMTLEQAKTAERKRWYTQTPIGLIFASGVALAVVVGGVISYMILASDVAAQASEYATLRAMGYSNRFLIRTLLTQSTLLAVAAFPPSLALSCLLYYVTSIASNIPIRMTTTWVVLVLTLSLLMCNVAGALALRKLLKAEPANLF